MTLKMARGLWLTQFAQIYVITFMIMSKGVYLFFILLIVM